MTEPDNLTDWLNHLRTWLDTNKEIIKLTGIEKRAGLSNQLRTWYAGSTHRSGNPRLLTREQYLNVARIASAYGYDAPAEVRFL